jgi:MYXO-CTERM domain-containing protein
MPLSACDQEPSEERLDTEFRIVGGQPDAEDPAVPFLLVYDTQSEAPRSVCSGTLIDSRFILTAAHCVDAGTLGFEVGAIGAYFGTTAMDDDPGFVFYTEAVGFTAHEGWDGASAPDQGNDIAVIELAENVPLQPIPINRQPLSDQDLGAPVRLVGWGITSGGGEDSGVKRAVQSQLFDFDGGFVVVGGPQTNTCSGDSGGPAFMQLGGQPVVVGVTSFGDAACEQYGVSTRVDAFADWIDAAMGGAPTPPPAGGGQIGDDCNTGDDCASGLCVDGGQGGFCSDACDDDGDCPDGWACFATDDPALAVCAPSSDEPDPTGEPNDPEPPSVGDDDDSDGDSGEEEEEDDDDDDDDDDDRGHADGGGRGCNVGGRGEPTGLVALFGLVIAHLRRRRR